MMYWLRFAVLVVGVLFLTYAVLSAMLVVAWRWVGRRSRVDDSDTLFLLRMLPMTVAVLVVALVAVPSFWSLEPAAADEGIGWPALLLFLAGAAWVVFRFARILDCSRKAAEFFALASPMPRPMGIDSELPAYELSGAGPNLFVAGLFHPRLFVSREAAQILDEREMRAAVRHELAHARNRDNIKQFLIHLSAFPLLDGLDRKWLQSAEVAADERAVSDELVAADLASALIKVGKANAGMPAPALGMSLVPENDAPVSARVKRLLDWKPGRSHRASRATQLVLLLLPVGAIAINLVWMVAQMHRFTEFLFQ